MEAYHLTPRRNKTSILRNGLTANTKRGWKTGPGVYFYLDKSITSDLAEYLQLEYPLLLVVADIDIGSALMDEDALLVVDRTIDDLRKIMPEDAVLLYEQWLGDNGGDAPAYESDDVADFKIGLIDRFKIRPHKDFPVSWGHYDTLTLRVAGPVIPIAIHNLIDRYEVIETDLP